MIEVKNLTRYYGTLPAIRDVSFSVDEGVVVGLLGLNGAGKSTVMKILAGLLLPTSGGVSIGGVDALNAPDTIRSTIGFLPEEPPLYREMTVCDFLIWCGMIKGAKKTDVMKRLPEVLEQCHLQEVAQEIIENLSHGYRKRVGIAQAIIHRPKLVILDEPISGLDPVQIIEMRSVLRGLTEYCTVLVSSHILSEISQTCDRIVVLHQGSIVAEGTEEELRMHLAGGGQLELTVRGDAALLEETLANHESVQEHSIHALNGQELHRVTVSFSEDGREALVRQLAISGIGIRAMREVRGDLEEMFLEFTRRDVAVEPISEKLDGVVDSGREAPSEEARDQEVTT
jgi:ABC-2 type transport system ATP-binding protein